MTHSEAGEILKKRRQQAGLSQKKAANVLGVTPNSLYFWESSRTFPKPELWDDLINLYKIDREELIELAGGKDSPRVRRYLAQHPERQDQVEREGKRIYLRSKPKVEQPSHKNNLHKRVSDLEQRVAELQESQQLLERVKELVQAFDRLQNTLK